MNNPHSGFRNSHQDIETAAQTPHTQQTLSKTYQLAFADGEFLCRPELRPVRLQLELLKTEMILDEQGIISTIVLFGGARVPTPEKAGGVEGLARFYEEARRFSHLITERSLKSGGNEDVITTGGGPGVMEAGNRGASEAGGKSIGLSIVLPHEQAPNEYISPDLCFNFHYFAIRKMHFLMRANAICVFPGGFGTMDEMFETLTLIQTGRMKQVPFLLFGEDFWREVINWDTLAKAGTISREDLDLFRFVETAEQAIEAIDTWAGAGQKRDRIPGR